MDEDPEKFKIAQEKVRVEQARKAAELQAAEAAKEAAAKGGKGVKEDPKKKPEAPKTTAVEEVKREEETVRPPTVPDTEKPMSKAGRESTPQVPQKRKAIDK